MQHSGKPNFGIQTVRPSSITAGGRGDGLIRSSNEREEIEVQIDAAHKYPRNISSFLQEANSLVTMSESTAESCVYALPRGKDVISGPSIRMAEICVSAYGNLHIAGRIKEIGDTHITSEGAVWDIEKNIRYLTENRRRIVDKNGNRYNEDLIILTGNASISIAIRNSVFRAIPGAYIGGIYQTAKEFAIGNATTFRDKKDRVLKRLIKLGVSRERVCYKLDIKDIEQITLQDLEVLIGLGTAIGEGTIDIDSAFPEPNTPPQAGRPRPTATIPAAATPAPAATTPAATTPAATTPAATTPAATTPAATTPAATTPATAQEAADKKAFEKFKIEENFKFKLIERLNTIGVSNERILNKLGAKTLSQITKEDVNILIDIGARIKNNETSLDIEFPIVEEQKIAKRTKKGARKRTSVVNLTEQEEPKQEEPKQEEPKQEEPKQEEPKQEEPEQEEPEQEEPEQEPVEEEEEEEEEDLDDENGSTLFEQTKVGIRLNADGDIED